MGGESSGLGGSQAKKHGRDIVSDKPIRQGRPADGCCVHLDSEALMTVSIGVNLCESGTGRDRSVGWVDWVGMNAGMP